MNNLPVFIILLVAEVAVHSEAGDLPPQEDYGVPGSYEGVHSDYDLGQGLGHHYYGQGSNYGYESAVLDASFRNDDYGRRYGYGYEYGDGFNSAVSSAVAGPATVYYNQNTPAKFVQNTVREAAYKIIPIEHTKYVKLKVPRLVNVPVPQPIPVPILKYEKVLIPRVKPVAIIEPYKFPVARDVPVPVYRPLPIRLIKYIPVIVPKEIKIPVPHPVLAPVLKPYPVKIIKEMPYAVPKPVQITILKPTPVAVTRYVRVPVPRPYPVHIPCRCNEGGIYNYGIGNDIIRDVTGAVTSSATAEVGYGVGGYPIGHQGVGKGIIGSYDAGEDIVGAYGAGAPLRW